MSRIAKRPIAIPEKTDVSYSAGVLTVKGPLGELKKTLRPEISIKVENNEISLVPVRHSLDVLALWGTYASHIRNMLAGVHTAFEKKLIVEGIGFKSDVKGKELHLSLGFSHPVMRVIPDGLKVTAEKNVITVSGMDTEKVGQFVAQVRSLKKPEPYKGKGIRYSDEVIRRKQGKKSV
ncbi:MAG: large subunit ribosomal protein [Patescibacteria group bacterium]|nr:large subunit ribosomal protein [Patescibacteria group bacterium]